MDKVYHPDYISEERYQAIICTLAKRKAKSGLTDLENMVKVMKNQIVVPDKGMSMIRFDGVTYYDLYKITEDYIKCHIS